MSAAAQQQRTQRWWRYLKKRQLTCPANHHQRETNEIPEYGFFRCSHWIDGEKRECGLWAFLYAVRGGGAFVAAVELKEMREMGELATPTAMLDYLGIFPL